MYYGYYYRGSISTFPFTSYHMPSAYLAITTVCITYQLIMLASRSEVYRVDTAGGVM